jgi:hypothetical protein
MSIQLIQKYYSEVENIIHYSGSRNESSLRKPFQNLLQKVRGIIIAREISEDLHLAASKICEVELFEYDLSVSLRKVNNA